MKTDLELQKDIMEELKWQPLLKSSDIGIYVNDGIVTLNGFVDSYSKKRLAESVVFRMKGVKAVAEEITVRFDTDIKNSDTEIAEASIIALKTNSLIPQDKIKITVEDGWITTKGEVEWLYEKEAVRQALENILGVRGVSNLVTIYPKVTFNVNEIKKKISAAFHRSATIDSNNIVIEVVANKVIISGIVQSYAEKLDAEHSAWNAPGVTVVENNLEVDVPVMVD